MAYGKPSGPKTSGKITGLKLNVSKEKKNGDTYKVHVLKIEDKDGEEKKFLIGVKSAPAKYMDNLKVGQKVTVQEAKNDYGYMNVVAVYQDREGGSKFGGKPGGKSDYSPLGAIQGMVLKAAIDVTLADSGTPNDVNEIVKAAKLVLSAKKKVDQLVAKALASKNDEDDEDDTDNEEDDETDSDDSDEEKDEKDDDEQDEKEDSDSDDEDSDEKPAKKKKSRKDAF